MGNRRAYPRPICAELDDLRVRLTACHEQLSEAKFRRENQLVAGPVVLRHSLSLSGPYRLGTL